MFVAENDVLTPAKIALDRYQEAREPKMLVMLPGGHFDPYVTGFEAASAVQLDWFISHLLTEVTTVKEDH